MRVLVTGAAGLIGSQLVNHLAAQGHEVRATDRRHRPGLGFPLVYADLERPDVCYTLLNEIDAAVHLANNADPHPRDPQGQFAASVVANDNLFRAAAELGVGRVLFASSVWVFRGDYYSPATADLPPGLYLPADGGLPPFALSPYGQAKYLSEQLLDCLVAAHPPLCAASLRLPSIITRRPEPAGARRAFGRYRDDRIESLRGELYSYLTVADLLRLVAALLAASWAGHRVYFPASRSNYLGIYGGMSVADVIADRYPGVPLRREAAAIGSLVDDARLAADTGWVAAE